MAEPQHRKLSTLTKLPGNPRTIKNEDFKRLCKSIANNADYFEARPLILSDRTGELIILAGNQRYEAAKHLGMKEVPTHLLTGLTEEREKEIIIRDNVSNGEWDMDILANEWEKEDLQEWGVPIQFDAINATAEEDDFEIPDEIQTDIVLGDLFEIGEHRLLCGDSTDSDAVARLMDGKKADMVFTDPPYGIKIVQNSSVGGSKPYGSVGGDNIVKANQYSKIAGDESTDAAREFYHTCLSLELKNFIFFGGNYFTDFLPPSMGWIVWYKKNTGNFADFEMAWTSYNKAAKLYEYLWNGLSREGSRDLELTKRVHPTQKPVGLSMQILNDYEWNICLDGFLGSGSTMVAAHQLNRKCYGMELDPKYCQVIVDRMRKLDPSLTIKRNGVEV